MRKAPGRTDSDTLSQDVDSRSVAKEGTQTVTHTEALDVLTAWMLAIGSDDFVAPERRAMATRHVADCPSCWEELFHVGKVLRTATPDIDDRMAELFGCHEIIDRLGDVAGLPELEVARRFPRIAQHLSRCSSCTEMLRDLEAALQDAESPALLSWKDRVVGDGEHILELMGRVAFRLRKGLMAGLEWPEGLALVPVGAAGAMRSRSNASGGVDDSGEAPGHSFSVGLGGIDLSIEVVAEPDTSDRVRLEVQVFGAERSVSITLRRLESGGMHVVAAQDAAPSKKFVASNLQVGAYHLEVREQPRATRRRIQLSFERA